MISRSTSLLISKTWFAFVSLVILYIICFVWIDKPLAFYLEVTFAHTALYHWCDLIKMIAAPKHWLILGVLSTIIGLIIKYRNPHAAKGWLLFGISIILSFVVCGVLKVILARYRPIELFEHGRYGFHWLSTKWIFNSTPSGHATEAFAGFCALARICRKHLLTILFIVLAIIIAASRVIETNHFLSDVIFGGYVGVICVAWGRAWLRA